MLVLSTTHGSQTFSRSSAKVYVFAMDCNNTNDRDFLQKKHQSLGRSVRVSASVDGNEECGFWYSSNIQAPEGTVISISSTVSKQGSIYAEGVMLLVLRENAPLIKISVKLCGPKNRASNKRIVAFSGRADILLVTEAEAYGVVYSKGLISRFFDKEELDEIYSVKVLQKGTPRPETISVPVGGGKIKRVVLPNTPRRRVRIVKY